MIYKIFSTAYLLCLSLFCAAPCALHAQPDPLEETEARWQEIKKETDSKWNRHVSDMERAWQRWEEENNRKWRQYVNEVNRIWKDTMVSTKKDWVEYAGDFSSRSRMDFKQGTLKIEAMVPDGKSRAEHAKEKMTDRLLSLYRQQDPVTGKSVLSGQLKTKTGNQVTRENLEGYIRNEVIPRISPDPLPVKGKDGGTRYRFEADIPLVPGHLRKRASRYKGEVLKSTQYLDLPPELICAVIHTESYFNPRARSSAGAYGLMQIIPRYAGREAYRYLFHEDRVIKPEMLYHPGKNIMLGTAYMHILHRDYLKGIKDPASRRYLAICSYNMGPTALRKRILDQYPVNSMERAALYSLLRKKTPGETRDYLKRVTERTGLYSGLFK